MKNRSPLIALLCPIMKGTSILFRLTKLDRPRTVVRSVILASVTLVSSGVQAELWQCTRSTESIQQQRSFFTENPVVGDDQRCERFELRRGGFNRASFLGYEEVAKHRIEEARARYGSPTGGLPEERGRLKGSRGVKPSEAVTDPQGRYYTSFQAEQIDSQSEQRKGRYYTGETLCRVRGQARGTVPGEAVVSITRGALTVDRVPVQIKGKRGAARWSVSLKGPCRNPEVRVEPAEKIR